MQIFLDQNLTFLAVPKAGSTAIEAALKPFASVEVKDPPADRHMTARRYRKTWEPYIAETWDKRPETIAVLRHPLHRLKSWYSYRNSPERKNSTEGMSFELFVRAVLSDDPPPPARIGSQHSFVSDSQGAVTVDHLFTLEDQKPFLEFLQERFEQTIRIEPRNSSGIRNVTLSPETEGLLYEARADEFALYDRVVEAGHLRISG